jgi:hypothetical protein
VLSALPLLGANTEKGTPMAGRSVLAQDKIRQRLDIYLTPEERAAAKEKADQARMPLAVYCRAAILGHKLKTLAPIRAEAYTELARVAANLNQLAKSANQGRIVDVSGDLIIALYEQVQALRRELLTGVPE